MASSNRSPFFKRLGNSVSMPDAEDLLAFLTSPEVLDRGAVLDFSVCRGISPGAGTRIGNAFRLFKDPKALLMVVPDSFEDEGDEELWFRVFDRSGLGLAASIYSLQIMTSNSDVKRVFKKRYSKWDEGRFTGNFINIPHIHTGVPVDIDQIDRFKGQLIHKWLGQMNNTVQRILRVSENRLSDLSQLCFESIQNVADHSARKPMDSASKVSSYFALGYYRGIRVPKAGPVTGFMKRTLGVSKKDLASPMSFIEIVINDSGVGVAARQSQDEAIYTKRPSFEERALTDALRRGGSVKVVAADCSIRGDPGFGFTHIEQSLRELRAFASLRSGRLQAIFDGTAPHKTGFVLHRKDGSAPLGYMPGTTLQIMIPLRSLSAGG